MAAVLRFRPVTASLVAVVLALILAACGGGSDEASEAAPEASVAAGATVTATVPVTPAPPDPTATAIPEPTATPAPTEPTATPIPEPTPTPVPESVRTTIDELVARDTPISLAHAGGDQDYPHSTMFAFKSAVAAGTDVLEVDVQLSGDGVLIVHHDATVDKTTNGTGLALDYTLDELQALDAGYWFAVECWPCRELPEASYLYRGVRTGEIDPPPGFTPDDFRIITFRELVEQFPQMPFDIEIKGEIPEALAVIDVLVAEIAELDLTDSVVVVAFSDEVIAAFEAAAPGVETSPGTNELSFWILTDTPIEGNRIVQVPPSFQGLEVVNAELIELASAAGIEVWVWPNDAATQENTDYYSELLALGVDGIIAGRPASLELARS